jgi:phospholipid transport system substrate-binding protein
VSRAGRFLGAVGLGWILTANGLAAATPGPEEVVRQTVDEVVAILQDPALDDQERRTRIEALAYERFHFETVSRLVLGRDWRRLLLLSRSYGERINRYEQEKVDILKVRDEPRGDVTVVTRIRGGAADGVEIAYRMRERDESWGVIDVTVEGTGLVSNYKSQFKELLGNGSPDDLLERLRKKNRTGAVPASPTTTTAGS